MLGAPAPIADEEHEVEAVAVENREDESRPVKGEEAMGVPVEMTSAAADE